MPLISQKYRKLWIHRYTISHVNRLVKYTKLDFHALPLVRRVCDPSENFLKPTPEPELKALLKCDTIVSSYDTTCRHTIVIYLANLAWVQLFSRKSEHYDRIGDIR